MGLDTLTTFRHHPNRYAKMHISHNPLVWALPDGMHYDNKPHGYAAAIDGVVASMVKLLLGRCNVIRGFLA